MSAAAGCCNAWTEASAAGRIRIQNAMLADILKCLYAECVRVVDTGTKKKLIVIATINLS